MDSRKYLDFSLCLPRVAVNTVILIAQTVIMLLEVPYWIIWQSVTVVFMLVFNGREIVKAVTDFLRRFLKNKQKNI
jgi:hypothetical protein